jgi:hypothetical protein
MRQCSQTAAKYQTIKTRYDSGYQISVFPDKLFHGVPSPRFGFAFLRPTIIREVGNALYLILLPKKFGCGYAALCSSVVEEGFWFLAFFLGAPPCAPAKSV